MRRHLVPILSFILAGIIFGGTALLAQSPSVQYQQIYNLIGNLQAQLNQIQQQLASLALPSGATSGQFLTENQTATAPIWSTVSGDAASSVITPGKLTVQGLQGIPIATNTPVSGQAEVYNGTNWAPGGAINITQGDLNGEIHTSAHGFKHSAQRDDGVTVTNGSTTLTIGQTRGGVFSAASVGQLIRIVDSTTGRDQDTDTIATFDSPTQVELAHVYPGTSQVATDTAVWGPDDLANWNALWAFVGSNTTGLWWPRKVVCDGPIITSGQLVIGPGYNVEFSGPGAYSGMWKSNSPFANGCDIIDMSKTGGVAVLQLQGLIQSRIHDFNIDPSAEYLKLALIQLSQTGGRTSSENQIWNVSDTLNNTVNPLTWGLLGGCSPAGNLTGGTATIGCPAPPVGLIPGQYVYIFDSVGGFEQLIVSSITLNTITLASNLAANHTNGNYTVLWGNNLVALAGIEVDSNNVQTDTNKFSGCLFQRVDTAYDIRQAQSIGGIIEHTICEADITCVRSLAQDISLRAIQQNITSIGLSLDRGASAAITGWDVQPGITGSSGQVAGTFVFLACPSNTSAAPGCAITGTGIQWATTNAAPANGDFMIFGPTTYQADINIRDLLIFQTSVAMSTPSAAQLTPWIHPILDNTNQSMSFDISYRMGVGVGGAMDLGYRETGTGNARAFRRVHLCPKTSDLVGRPPQCTDQILAGTDVYTPLRTDIPGLAAAGSVQTALLSTPAAPTGLVCTPGDGAGTWEYFVSYCTDPACVYQTPPSLGTTITGCNSVIDANHTVAGSVGVLPKYAAAANVFACPSTGGCTALTTATSKYIVASGTGPQILSAPAKTAFLDNGTPTGTGLLPQSYNNTGGIQIAGTQQYPNPIVTAIAGLPSPCATPGTAGLTGFQVSNQASSCSFWATPVATASAGVNCPVRCDPTSNAWRISN